MEPISEQQKPIEQQPKQISTEAPKGFLHKVRETMKDTAILFSPSGALALGFIKATGELGGNGGLVILTSEINSSFLVSLSTHAPISLIDGMVFWPDLFSIS